MYNRYDQGSYLDTETHFSSGISGEVEHSVMFSDPTVVTTFNAGDIVPILDIEILPNDTFELDLDFVIRQTTLKYPTMGNMFVDFFAFFVPHRIVNQSAKSVFGENVYGVWAPNAVEFAPLWNDPSLDVQIPVGSVADYYNYPTQEPLSGTVLVDCHDLKFRGYVEIYNEYFRDQNYQAPVAYSKLNVYEGFLSNSGSNSLASPSQCSVSVSDLPDNSYGVGAVRQAVYGNMDIENAVVMPHFMCNSSFLAIGKPLKACKLHDYFTSVLPSPQKFSGSVFVSVSGASGTVPVYAYPELGFVNISSKNFGALKFVSSVSPSSPTVARDAVNLQTTAANATNGAPAGSATFIDTADSRYVSPTNLVFDSEDLKNLSISITDIRTAAAVQQVYEQLARSGSRYRSYVAAFFGIDAPDLFKDIPEFLGRFRRKLDLYQVSQTSETQASGTPQGNLAGFGYTNSHGRLFSSTFLENGYLHVFAVVRHKNVYSTLMTRDNFRRSMLDFYQPQLANISETPVYTREINPFHPQTSDGELSVFGYQEPFADYRYDPDRVTGYMRPGIEQSLASWNYADPYTSELVSANSNWIQSNSEEVLNRSLVFDSSVVPQFKGQFNFHIKKQRAMPVFGVPGMDTI